MVGLALGLGLTLAGWAGLSQAAAVEAVEPHLGGAAIGYHMVLVPLGAMVGPPVFGRLVDARGYTPGWLAAAAVLLAGTGLLAAAFTEGRAGPRARRPAP
jgi:MFS family permease